MNKLVKGLCWGGLAAVVLTGAGYCTYISFNERDIHLRTDKKIETGYVLPKRLDITVEDKNKNGESEVYLHYNHQDYVLTLDSYENPVIKKYEVIPGKEIPAENIPPKIVIEK